MSNKAILRRLKKLEKVFAVEPKDDWIDILLWSGSEGRIFEHTHCRFSESRRKTEWLPCSDAEEIKIMRRDYEEEGHRFFGKSSDVSFAEYLERFTYLGSRRAECEKKGDY